MQARQLAVKAIYEDKVDVSNPSIMAKYMNKYTNSKLNKIVKELEEKIKEERKPHYMDRNIIYIGVLEDVIEIIKKELK